MEMIKNIVLFVLLLSIIVAIHELGHLIAAKIFGVYCSEYSIGMGPKIFSKQFKETQFCIRAFPLGGFVAMAGDNENALETTTDTTDIPFERTLPGIIPWKRIIIMLAGIFMNIILAILIYGLILLSNGEYATSSKPVIVTINENYPAYNSGLETGDLISEISFDSGVTYHPSTYRELSTLLSTYDGNGPWHIVVERNDEEFSYSIEPIYLEDEQRYVIGIGFSETGANYVKINIFNCFIYAFDYAFFVIKMIISSLSMLFTENGLNNLSGPVGIYQTVEEVASYGMFYYVQLIAMISLNVGVFNALPLPVFDGGRVFLTLIEMIIGRPLDKKVEELIMTISVFMVLALFIFVSANDIFKLFRG